MKTLSKAGLCAAMILVAACAHADANPAESSMSKQDGMMCPMMSDMAAMQKQMDAMMADMDAMMADIGEPAMKARMKVLRDRISEMKAGMSHMGGMMKDGQHPSEEAAPTAAPPETEDREAHHPEQ
jgi:hypothetical protein